MDVGADLFSDKTAQIGAQATHIQRTITSNQVESSIRFDTIQGTVVDQATHLQETIQSTADTIRSDVAQSEGRLATHVMGIGETLSQTRQIAEDIRGETSVVNEAVQSLLRQKPTAITDALYSQLFSSLKEVVKEALQEEKLESEFGNAMSIDAGRKASILIQSKNPQSSKERNDQAKVEVGADSEFPRIRRQQTFTKISGEYQLSRETSPDRCTAQPIQKSVKRRTLGFGSLRVEITKVISGSTQNTRIDLTFHPAMWTFHKGALITLQRISRVFQGRTITIKPNTFNIVSMDSEIFNACRNLDLDAIQDLFLARKASPFDRDEYGGSLLDWTLQALLEGHKSIQPDKFQRQRLIEILRLLLDSGLRFEPKPAHPKIKSTHLQIFLSSGQLLTLAKEVAIPILDPWMSKWDDISASIFFSLSTDALNDIYFRLDITEFLRKNLQTAGTYVYFEHNLASIYWVGQLQEQMYARLYLVQPKRALAALIESDDFAEACAPRSVLQVDEHLNMLQKAIHEKSPTWSWGMHAVARFLSKGRRFSRLEMQELTYCAERYRISEFWNTVTIMAGYSEDVITIPDLDDEAARSKIPGEWVDHDEQEAWQDLVWSGRCVNDEDGTTSDEVEEKPRTKIENVNRIFKMMKKGQKLKQLKRRLWYERPRYICFGHSIRYHVKLEWNKGNWLFVVY